LRTVSQVRVVMSVPKVRSRAVALDRQREALTGRPAQERDHALGG
jgi:hypothetical protein